MDFLIVVIVGLLFAWLCYTMADSRNRSTLLWGIMGFIFGIFAVIVLALIGTKREKTS